MNDLFDKSDVLTTLTRKHVKVGNRGYFGNTLTELATDVEHGQYHVLAKIYDEDSTLYPFKGNHYGRKFALFLPADKVKKSCRALESFEELFDFLMPNCNTNFLYGEDGKKIDFDQCEKAKVLIGTKIVLKDKITKRIRVMVIQSVEFSSDSSDNSNVYLNCFSLNELFNTYEIQINDEWVPFGIER